jgi:enterochelin esterase-like enzyme
MKNIISFLAVASLMLFNLSGQTGRIMDNLSMPSKILRMDRKYAIYLPPDYETSLRSYPVLYLLHGGGDDQTGWVQFGQVQHIADNNIIQGKVTPMIIVMPDANTGQRGYFNDIKGDWRYEDFFFQEFIPYIEKQYRIRSEKQYRAVAGVSMGGGGSFMYALHHPEMFSSSCPLSASTGPLSKDVAKKYYEQRGFKDFTDAELDTYYKRHSVLPLLDSMAADQKKAVRWYIDCGDDDFLYEGNSQVHIAMRKLEIPHEFRIRDGVHGWVYWREALPEVLDFISDAFHQY